MSEKQTKKKLKVNVDGLVNEMPKAVDERELVVPLESNTKRKDYKETSVSLAEPVALVKPKRVATGATIEALAKGRAKLQDSSIFTVNQGKAQPLQSISHGKRGRVKKL